MKRSRKWCWFGVLAAVVVVGACSSEPAPAPAAVSEAVPFPAIDGAEVLEHTRALASDEYEGRAPGTKGEDLTIAYIEDQFRKAGLRPGNPDGTFIEKVPLVGITPDASKIALTLRKGARKRQLRFKDDFVAWTKRVVEKVALDDSELVFVGYGTIAPEFNWDDYKGVDLKGKTMVVLVGDPPVPDPADATRLDPAVFGGRAMTYYGRWTYKYEIGAKLGAAGVIIVHETEPAGYPFSVVQGKTAEQFDLVAGDNNMSRCAIEGWVPLEQARQLFEMAGMNYDEMKRAAVARDFKPVPLGVTVSIAIENRIRRIDSRNVVGKVEGSDPALADEYVIYTSHWDHFGINAPVDGDAIYNGAQDNATGIAGLIALGKAFASLPQKPKRSILFLAVTAEEQGLLGSAYYATNPLYPLANTVAVINMDSLNVHGKTNDLQITGLGNSELDDYAAEVARMQGRVVKGDPTPEKGSYYRSDHFPFAKEGVPALASGGGIDYAGKPADYGRKLREEYTALHYHQPSDEVRPDWDMSGAVQDLQYYWMVAYRVAQADKYPEWKPGTEFKALREAQLKAAGKGTGKTGQD
ncbi:MAG: M28 family metallopeptidase [Vicinamibacterales bacterium]